MKIVLNDSLRYAQGMRPLTLDGNIITRISGKVIACNEPFWPKLDKVCLREQTEMSSVDRSRRPWTSPDAVEIAASEKSTKVTMRADHRRAKKLSECGPIADTAQPTAIYTLSQLRLEKQPLDIAAA